MNAAKPFEAHQSGALLHGTKADLAVGDLLVPGRPMNHDTNRIANHVYVTYTVDAAVWGAELAVGDGPGRIYLVEARGELEDDPNVTDKRFPGNPTRSYQGSRSFAGDGAFAIEARYCAARAHAGGRCPHCCLQSAPTGSGSSLSGSAM